MRKGGKHMANTIVQSMALRISYDHGMDDNNKQVVKTASYSKIDRQASAAALLSVANTLGNLSAHDVHAVTKVTTEALTN